MPHPLLSKMAPKDMSLKNQHGEDIHLSDYIGKSIVVLFFYPKDHTFVCTRQVCAFRDHLEKIHNLGAEVIGVSGDTVKSHESFSHKQNLPYNLLSDSDGKLRAAFKVSKFFFAFPQRATYIIDKDGIVKNIIESFFSYSYHVNNVIRFLERNRLFQYKEENDTILI